MAGDKAGDNQPDGGERGVEGLWATIDGHGALIRAQGELLKDVVRELDVITGRLDAMNVNNDRNQQGDGGGARDRARGQPIVKPVPENRHGALNPLCESDSYEDPFVEYENNRVE